MGLKEIALVEALRVRCVPIAYRGGAVQFPENSCEAIASTLQAVPGAAIEVDLRTTKDHVVIAFHDATLDRLTQQAGMVSSFSWTDLQRLNLSSHSSSTSQSRIPSLEQLLEKFPATQFVLDIHESDPLFPSRVLSIIDNQIAAHRVVIVSSLTGVIESMSRFRPDLKYLASGAQTRRFFVASKFQLHRWVCPSTHAVYLPERVGHQVVLSARLIDFLRNRNIKVWTSKNFRPYENINSPAEYQKLANLGVDAVYTDNPASLLCD